MIIVTVGLTLVYLAVLVWLRNGLNTLPGKNHPRPAQAPEVSIIVAARNEEKTIGTLLRDAVNQDYPGDRVEIIVVNDRSTDGTGDIVDRFSKTHPSVTQVVPGPPPPSWSYKKWALTEGVARSKGEILLFTDADCRLNKEWISTTVAPFRDPRIGMVAGPSPLEKDGGLWDRMLLLDSLGQDALAAGGLGRGLSITASGRNLAIRRKVFDQMEGYSHIETFPSGDDDLMMHKVSSGGWKLTFCLTPAAEVKSPPPPDLLTFVRQRLRFASKGKDYFVLPFVRSKFRGALILIFLVNVSVLGGQIQFLTTLQSVWMLPWFVKMLADGILLTRYLSFLERPFYPGVFLMTELWHSAYVTFFGVLGSFLTVSWKGRKQKPRAISAD
ncbi:MAG: glycosyltransferase [Fidelibacterota bacterium]